MIVVKGGVTAPEGFLANGVKAGIKKSGNKDLGIIYSGAPCAAAGSFTTNRFAASPVKISKLRLNHKVHHAVIVNSGNANCANGKKGDLAAAVMTELAARALDLKMEEVLVASTGIIGRPLPIEKIGDNIPALVKGLSSRNGAIFAETIMTTDTVKKEMAVKERLGGKLVCRIENDWGAVPCFECLIGYSQSGKSVGVGFMEGEPSHLGEVQPAIGQR